MENLPAFLVCALCAAAVVLLAALVRRRAPASEADIAATLKSSIDPVMAELRRAENELKTETNNRLEALRMAVDNRLDGLSDSTAKKFGESSDRLNAASAETRKTLDARLEKLTETLDGKLDRTRVELAAAAAETRKTLDDRLEGIIAKNEEKLEQMRLTVDEKLQSTLEKRLTESFKLVGDNLDKVIQSMGEMRAVAADVGDLRRVLTNVKSRGTWGEYQLSLILETLLQPDQYEANVKPRPRSDNIVEFAVKLPGRDADGKPVWLPIDSKFPKEDYERLTDASARADAEGVENAARALSANIENSAREIRDKYIAPPHTTDFDILFLPTEGLYAETLRRPGLVDKIQRECRVLIAGPTTLAALLNSLQMGFRTLAIEKRSSEVWKMLGAIKTQFGRFGDTLENVQKKLDAAGREIGEASQRHRVITNKLARVEELPAEEAAQLLPETASDN
jgi:DNA recombination protein RmuC